MIAIGDADADKLLERNEVYEIRLISLSGTGDGDNKLTNTLGVSKTFSLEVIPPRGAVLFIERTTPVYLDKTTSLD